MRKSYVVGNWKMNKTIAESVELVKALISDTPADAKADVAVIPPFLSVPAVVEAAKGSLISVGVQDAYFEKSGAFTGEIAPFMVKDAGATFALVGHSERRHVIGETDELIRKKLEAILKEGLDVILCVGELIEEREAGETEKRLNIQIRAGLEGLTKEQMKKITVAYEPVWAIGTGKTATTAQAQEAHKYIRGLLIEIFDADTADKVRIQYGGSVKPDNAEELMSQPDVDGALVGGASLKAEQFVGIIKGA